MGHRARNATYCHTDLLSCEQCRSKPHYVGIQEKQRTQSSVVKRNYTTTREYFESKKVTKDNIAVNSFYVVGILLHM